MKIASTLARSSRCDGPTSVAGRFAAWLHWTNLDWRASLDEDWLVTILTAYPGLMTRMRDEIRCSDLGIRDVKVLDGPTRKSIRFDHDGVDESLPLHMESDGTSHLLRLLPRIDLALNQSVLALRAFMSRRDCQNPRGRFER